jgi:hypothetical protein
VMRWHGPMRVVCAAGRMAGPVNDFDASP